MHTLQISDGTTTVSLLAAGADGLQLKEAGWAPSVATARQSDLGGIGAWEDVDEQITVTAKGATGLADLRTVQRLLDQGRRWARGESVAAVTLRARIDNSVISGSTALQAAILGGTVALAEDHLDQLFIGEVREATIRLRRRGAWLDPVLESATATTGLSQIARTATFAATHHTASPVEVRATLADGTRREFAIINAEQAADITVVEAESATSFELSGWSTPAVAGARGGSVARLTQGAVPFEDRSVVFNLASIPYRTFDVYATVNPTSATPFDPWTLTALIGGSNASELQAGPAVPVFNPLGTPIYRLVHLGTFTISTTLVFFQLFVERLVGGTVGGTIDIDALFFVNNRPQSGVVVFTTRRGAVTDRMSTVHRPLALPRAVVQVRDTLDAAVAIPSAYSGDPSFMVPPGNTWNGMFITIDGFQGVAPDGNVTLTAVRQRAYLVLE